MGKEVEIISVDESEKIKVQFIFVYVFYLIEFKYIFIESIYVDSFYVGQCHSQWVYNKDRRWKILREKWQKSLVSVTLDYLASTWEFLDSINRLFLNEMCQWKCLLVFVALPSSNRSEN